MGSQLIVVSGLPASGKTTLGRQLADRMSLPLIDKDEILEALFDSLGCADRIERSRLSRASDEVVLRLAEAAPAAVLVNWWDHDTAPVRLSRLAPSAVEVFCDCPAATAAARFESRKRHPGHHDPHRSPDEIRDWVARMEADFRGPLGLGRLVRVDTSRAVDVAAVVAEVRGGLDAPPPLN